MSLSRERSRAIGMLLVATPCWALSFPVTKALELEQQKLLPGANSWFLTGLGVMIRFGISALLLLPLLFRAGRFNQCELEQGVLLAIFGGGGILLQMDGLAYTAASTSAFLTQVYTIFIPAWVMLTTRRLPTLKVCVSVFLVMTGVAVLADLDLRSLRLGRGEVETILASLSFTGQIILLERPRYAANRPLQFSIVMYIVMALISLPIVCLLAPNVGACFRAYASPATCAFMAVLVLLCTLVAYSLMNYWQKRVTATEAGLIYCIEPVCASIFALFMPAWFSLWAGIIYPNESLTARLLIGGTFVTAANILLQSRWLEPSQSNQS